MEYILQPTIYKRVSKVLITNKTHREKHQNHLTTPT